MKRSRFAMLGASAVLLSMVIAGCSGSGSPHPQASKTSTTSVTSTAPPASPSTTPARVLFARNVINTAFGDPPRVDVCATLGTTLFQNLGYAAIVPDGQRAGACLYALSRSASSSVGAAAIVLVSVNSGGSTPDGVPTLDGFPVRITKPTSANDPCEEHLLASPVDLSVQAYAVDVKLSATQLCAFARAAALRSAAVLHRQIAPVRRNLNPDSLVNENICDALAGTANYTDLPTSGRQSGFGGGCDRVSQGFRWTFEIHFGVLPGDPSSSPATVGGHRFLTNFDPASGDCRYRWEGPSVPGTSLHEELTIERQVSTPSLSHGCTDVGELAGQLITALGRH